MKKILIIVFMCVALLFVAKVSFADKEIDWDTNLTKSFHISHTRMLRTVYETNLSSSTTFYLQHGYYEPAGSSNWQTSASGDMVLTGADHLAYKDGVQAGMANLNVYNL